MTAVLDIASDRSRWFGIRRLALALASIACLSIGTTGCGANRAAAERPPLGQGAHGDPSAFTETSELPHSFRFFSPSSFWNKPLAPNARLAPESSALVGRLALEVEALQASRQGPWINTRAWSVPIYTVGRSQQTVRVRLLGPYSEHALQSAWNAVPLPTTAQPAEGKDAHLVVWQPSTGRLWEFWHLTHDASGWSAGWGGAIRDAPKSSGVYGPRAWPGAKPWWGASASSLSVAGGLITLEDLQRGEIDHGLAISLTDVRAGVYAAPARRDDGTSVDPLSLPEGARLRLPADLDLAALHLPKLTFEIASAAQRYGLIVRDRSFAISFFAQDPAPTGTEPFAGPNGYFEGHYPNELLASFPWSQLQVLALRLHPNGRGSRHQLPDASSACAAGCDHGGRTGA